MLQVINNSDWIEGFYIRFRDLSDPSATYSLITVLNAETTSYTVSSLRKFTKYDFFMVPFYKTIEGQPSNSMTAQTSEDGRTFQVDNILLGSYLGPIPYGRHQDQSRLSLILLLFPEINLNYTLLLFLVRVDGGP